MEEIILEINVSPKDKNYVSIIIGSLIYCTNMIMKIIIVIIIIDINMIINSMTEIIIAIDINIRK